MDTGAKIFIICLVVSAALFFTAWKLDMVNSKISTCLMCFLAFFIILSLFGFSAGDSYDKHIAQTKWDSGSTKITGTISDIYDEKTLDGANTYVVIDTDNGEIIMNLDNEDNIFRDSEYIRNNLRVGDSVSGIVAPVENTLNEVYGSIRITDTIENDKNAHVTTIIKHA